MRCLGDVLGKGFVISGLFIAVFGWRIALHGWKCSVGDDVFVVGHDWLLNQKIAVDGLWVGHRIAEGRGGFRELGWIDERLLMGPRGYLKRLLSRWGKRGGE